MMDAVKPTLMRHHFQSPDKANFWVTERELEARLRLCETAGWTYQGFVPVPRESIPECVRDGFANV